jgi:hypothetical protein
VYPLDRESTSKLFHRTCGKGGGRKGDGSTADRRLVFLRAHVVRVAAATTTMVDRNMAIDQACCMCRGLACLQTNPPRAGSRSNPLSVNSERLMSRYWIESGGEARIGASSATSVSRQ